MAQLKRPRIDNEKVQVLENAVFSALTDGQGERFELHPSYLPRLTEALSDLLQTPAAAEAVDQLLRLIVAFRTKLDSPSVADQLSAMLSAEPAAQAFLRRYGQARSSIEQARAQAKFQGESSAVRAPTESERTSGNRDGLRVSDFINPGRQGRP
ncbi:MAG: hypothetical protein AAFN74_03345 [Myxococcota bacterium]